MKLRLKLDNHLLTHFKRKETVYLPDFIMYDLNQSEYSQFWHGIVNKSPKKHLYTNGIQVTQVGRFRAAFESFKGWLGYENKCHQSKVNMTLGKIAYAGYLKGLKCDELNTLAPTPISQRFIELVNQSKSDQTSCELQHLLVSYHKNHAHNILPSKGHALDNYHFGQVFLDARLISWISTIDLQDKSIISQGVNLAFGYDKTPQREIPSKFAVAYADEIIQRALRYGYGYDSSTIYNEALSWDPEIEKKYLMPYIKFYAYLVDSKQKPKAMMQKVALLHLLAESPHAHEQHIAVEYAKNYFKHQEQVNLFEKESALRKKVAQAYLAEAKTENGKWLKTFRGNKTIEHLAQAVRLDPTILAGESTMSDITLMNEWALHLFHQALAEKRLEDADAVYQEYSKRIAFPSQDLEKLMGYYQNLYDKITASVEESLANSELDQALVHAKKRVAVGKKIKDLDNEYAGWHKESIVEQASLLLKIDKIKHPDAKEAELELLNQAQSLLTEFNLLNRNANTTAIINEILLRKIAYYHAKLLVPVRCDNWSERELFVKAHESDLFEFQANLKLFIELNKTTKGPQINAQLAKAHFILADSMYYFQSNQEAAIPLFKKASEFMPGNPYYRDFHAQLIDDKNTQEKTAAVIEGKGHLSYYKYTAYFRERWYIQRFESDGLDIHAVEPETPGFLKSFFGGF